MEENLYQIFQRLKATLMMFEKPTMAPKIDLDSRYELWSQKDVVINGRRRREVFFAALIIQSNYVGFYFMPVYIDTSLKEVFAPELLKLLKGESCFHIKQLDENLENRIFDALRKGYDLYKQRGWI